MLGIPIEPRNSSRGRGRRYADIESPFEGRRWCDTTERELIGGITNYPSSPF
jgi:hypothetical protein